MSVGVQAFYRITEKIKEELLSNENINTVTRGDITQIDLAKQTIFPLAHVMINNIVNQERVLNINITVFTMDIVDYSKDASLDTFRNNDNEIDVINTQLAVAMLLIEKLRSGQMYLDKFQLEGTATHEQFNDRFENQLAGIATTFNVLVQNDIDNGI